MLQKMRLSFINRDQVLAMIGAFVRIFVYVISGIILANGSIRGIDWANALDAGIIAVIGLLYSYFNPKDPRFGKAKVFTVTDKPNI